MLSCVDVFISCKQVCKIRNLIFSCFHFQGLKGKKCHQPFSSLEFSPAATPYSLLPAKT